MQDAERILTLLEPILSATSIEAAAAETARQLGPAMQAVALGFFVVMHGRPFLEFWYPDRMRHGDVELHLQRLALETARTGVPIVQPFPDGAVLVPQVHVLPLQDRLSAILCFATAPDTTPAATDGRPIWERVAGLIALRMTALIEVEAERRRSGQYQRWFRVTDKQIRALDLERQKFAGLVDAIQIGVFVADRERVIRWNSRPLLGQFPVPEEGSWVGRSCEHLCRRMRPANTRSCDDCLVARVLQDRQAAECVVQARTGAGEQVLRVTAIPINDLDGHAHEVLVAFQTLNAVEREQAA